MYLEILTPDKKVFSGEVSSVHVPGVNGQFQVLDHHAAIISTLGAGLVIVREANTKKEFNIDGGVVEVLDNKVIVLAETIVA
jgi:F-type H+-transporting ATPase subunit epsilon